MPASRVCVVGSINADLTFTVHALPQPGETILASSLHSAPGGKGGNQAVAAARAGATVALVAAVGEDPAATMLLSHLRANGVSTETVSSVAGPSGSAVIVVDVVGENSIVVAPGANARLEVDSASARTAIVSSDVVLVQLEIPAATALAAARLARAAGAIVILNASPTGTPATQLSALSELVDVVLVNETEATEWRWAVKHLVVTRGSKGARYIGTDEQFEIPATTVESVDTTGAGDVFAGVLAANWTRGRETALRRACAAGALATLVRGAGDCAPTVAEIDAALTR